jgi:hypothetical protein
MMSFRLGQAGEGGYIYRCEGSWRAGLAEM